MNMIKWLVEILVCATLLLCGEWLLDVPVPFDMRESLLHFVGLLVIMFSVDVARLIKSVIFRE